MPRTAAPATPGDEPKTNTSTSAADAAELKAAIAADLAGEAAADSAGKDDELARLRAEMAEMRTLMGQMVRQQTSNTPTHVPLPSMKEALAKGTPQSPVLTAEGWFVPAVLPSQRQVA